jgi:hypothetical protein
MALLAPLFYTWILLKTKKEIVLPFITILAPFILVQLLYNDITRKVYFDSLINLVTVYIFCCAVYLFLKLCNDAEVIFKKILVINFILCLVAIVVYFTPWYRFMWIEQNITEGVSNFRRVKLFTYEASYYATLFVPIFCFYLVQYLFRQNTIKGRKLLPMICLPYVLSFSFGVIAALAISAGLVYFLNFPTLAKKRRIFNGLIFSLGFFVLFFCIVYFFFRDSFFVLRLFNIAYGNDTSANGRTSDAFFLANKLAHMRNEYWGVGLGQIKIMGADVIRKYYLYGKDFVPRIPNAAAETLATFGWTGFLLRIFVELFFFFRTKVWTNYYRLWLFLFIFIYQFTGSFITNVAEYVIWILAFTNVFAQFDLKQRRVKNYTAFATDG